MKKLILDYIQDLVSNFVYYDRKEDEDLSGKQLEDAVKSGEITVEEMVDKFREGLNHFFEE